MQSHSSSAVSFPLSLRLVTLSSGTAKLRILD
uniref:Uncharacterized protein n=1 Tax=Anguilla anguilla TaxID=7936 RepID=A0A0E9QGU1_ANGAN